MNLLNEIHAVAIFQKANRVDINLYESLHMNNNVCITTVVYFPAIGLPFGTERTGHLFCQQSNTFIKLDAITSPVARSSTSLL